MSGLLCQRDACPIELRMRAMEHWRAKQAENGIAPSFSPNDYWESCKLCQSTKGWQFKDGLVKAL